MMSLLTIVLVFSSGCTEAPVVGEVDEDIDGWHAEVDCDDQDPSVHPGAGEICDGRDEDCDGLVDNDAANPKTWFLDADADGWGARWYSQAACDRPPGYIEAAGDCDDGDAASYPTAPEHCDGIDEDCDGVRDNAPVDAPLSHRDADMDGYGDPSVARKECKPPDGFVWNADDCDDTSEAFHPGVADDCNDGDNDCDGSERLCPYAGKLAADGAAALTIECALSERGCHPPNLGGDWDITGDTLPDLVMAFAGAAPSTGRSAGLLWIWQSPVVLGGVRDASTATVRVLGDSANESFGTALERLRAGDGSTRLVVSAPNASTGSVRAGKIFLFGLPSAPETTASDAADTIIFGDTAEGIAGSYLAAGRFTDDDEPDLLVWDRASDGFTWTHRLRLLPGPLASGSVSLGDFASTASIASYTNWDPEAVDLDADGIDDLVVGDGAWSAPATNNGAAFVFYGPLSPAAGLGPADADSTLYGEFPNTQDGAPTAVGDIDGDGRDDLAVSSPSWPGSGLSKPGRVSVVYGPPPSGTSSIGDADIRFTGDTTSSAQLGVTRPVSLDIDANTTRDLVLCAKGYQEPSTNQGGAFLWYAPGAGAHDIEDADAVLVGNVHPGTEFGGSAATAGDVNADGFDDLLIGDRYDGGLAVVWGRAHLFLGGDSP